ncbi:hypothetical protein MGWOODY_Tha796 [hydrothermal vent metagenome]|uniref:Uncharacterized protein n=1 Tax=hydrothermal vent metagenome TaxID=652676 RepID=A0A160TDD5_9ZZZZ
MRQKPSFCIKAFAHKMRSYLYGPALLKVWYCSTIFHP